jgi:alpha-D-ribose 1-methylphosphonate 5-triphosphate synthase subunit PhnG
MASESRKTRLKQKAEWEVKLQKRLTLLAEKGADKKKIAGDVQVKALKSKIKESQRRLQAIDNTDKKTAELAAIKAERLMQPKEESPKKKKVEEPLPEAKPKKKKKKEEGTEAQQV